MKGKACLLMSREGKISTSHCALPRELKSKHSNFRKTEREGRHSASETQRQTGSELQLLDLRFKGKGKKTSQSLGWSSSEDQLNFGKQQREAVHRSWKLSEVCCHRCHLLTAIFILPNHSQTSPLELITFTQSSHLSCGFCLKIQKS